MRKESALVNGTRGRFTPILKINKQRNRPRLYINIIKSINPRRTNSFRLTALNLHTLSVFRPHLAPAALPRAMTSMAFSSVFLAPLQSSVLTKLQLSSNSVMAFLDSSNRSSLSSSKSTFFRDGFSVLSPIVSGFPLKSRSFASVYARAATGKTIHDFSVKVTHHLSLSLPLIVTLFSIACLLFPFYFYFSTYSYCIRGLFFFFFEFIAV